MFDARYTSVNGGMFTYGHLAVIEKALRQQALTVAERRAAAHLAVRFKNKREELLSVQLDAPIA